MPLTPLSIQQIAELNSLNIPFVNEVVGAELLAYWLLHNHNGPSTFAQLGDILQSIWPSTAYKTADEDRVATTALAADSQLLVTVAANTKYQIDGVLFMNEVDSGMKIALGGTCTFDSLKAAIAIYDTVQRASGVISAFDSAVTHNTTGGGQHWIYIRGTIEVAQRPGIVNVQWAQNTSDPVALTMQRNSMLRLTPVS